MNNLLLESDYHLPLSITPSVPEKRPEKYTITRVAKAFLPLLVMVTPLCRTFEVIGGIVHLHDSLSNAAPAFKVLKVAYSTAALALLIVCPVAVSLSQNIIDIAVKTNELSKCIISGGIRQNTFRVLKITEKCVYVLSIILAGPEIILISMIVQASMEIYRMHKYYTKEMYLEAVVHSVAAGARSYGVYKHIKKNELYFLDLMRSLREKFVKMPYGSNSIKLESVAKACPWGYDEAGFQYSEAPPNPLPEGWEMHQASQEIVVDYGGSIIVIHQGSNYFTFEGKVAIGWHGTVNPPMGMG